MNFRNFFGHSPCCGNFADKSDQFGNDDSVESGESGESGESDEVEDQGMLNDSFFSSFWNPFKSAMKPMKAVYTKTVSFFGGNTPKEPIYVKHLNGGAYSDANSAGAWSDFYNISNTNDQMITLPNTIIVHKKGYPGAILLEATRPYVDLTPYTGASYALALDGEFQKCS